MELFDACLFNKDGYEKSAKLACPEYVNDEDEKWKFCQWSLICVIDVSSGSPETGLFSIPQWHSQVTGLSMD